MSPVCPFCKWMNCVMLVLASLAIRKDALVRPHSCAPVILTFWLCKWNRFSEWIKNWLPLIGKTFWYLQLALILQMDWFQWAGLPDVPSDLSHSEKRHFTKYPQCLNKPRRYLWTPLHSLSRPVSSARHCLALWATSLLFHHSLK